MFSRAVLIGRAAWPYLYSHLFIFLLSRPKGLSLFLALNAGGHSGVVIPVPVPNTEVKHPYADDTPIRGKVGSRRLFSFLTKSFVMIRVALFLTIFCSVFVGKCDENTRMGQNLRWLEQFE